MRHATFFLTLGLAAVVAVSACTVKDVDAPGLAGPSTFATSITMRSSTDTLIQDGASQATITITAIDEKGAPKNIPLRAEILVDGVVQDYGKLNTKQPTANGTPLVYTAPPASSLAAGQVAQTVTIAVTPMDSGDFRGQTSRQIDLRLVPQGVILPTNPNLVAAFDASPTSPEVLQAVTFSAGGSTNNGAACNSACSYNWDFGDGTSGTGISLTHTYRAVGTYIVGLTVTDSRGATALLSKPVTVSPGTPPTASFTFSPTPAIVDQTIFFNATASKPAAGRTIVSYDWDFGKGTTGTGVTTSKAYDTPGTYTVTLKLTDDAGSIATTVQTVTVNSAQIQPNFTIEPAAPVVNQPVVVNASSSTSTSPIVSYSWSFGVNSTPSSGSGVSASTQYSVSGSKVITLTVTDNQGRTASMTKVVTVSP